MFYPCCGVQYVYKTMNIPSRKESLGIICRAGMMEHIAAHSLQVCRVALVITDLLNRERTILNRGLIEAGALLHDITKTRSLKTGERHAETGGWFLCELGYPEVGELVRQHVRLDHFDFHSPVNEAEIVNYADKRVLHDQIVSLQERMAYILHRYGTTPELRIRLEQIGQEAKAQEKKIFSRISFAPEQLTNYMDSPVCDMEMAEYRMALLL